MREAIFNHLAAAHLGHDWSGLRVLDLFAGSGALGLEALSRGADHATFIDRDPRAIESIRTNIAALGVDRRTIVIKRDADRALSSPPGGPFGLIFADPPYATVVTVTLLTSLAAESVSHVETLLVIEHATTSPPEQATDWEIANTRSYGDTALTILRRTR